MKPGLMRLGASNLDMDIKELRKKLGLTQGEFAHRLKVDPTIVSRWERGINRPSPACVKRLNRLAKKNGC